MKQPLLASLLILSSTIGISQPAMAVPINSQGTQAENAPTRQDESLNECKQTDVSKDTPGSALKFLASEETDKKWAESVTKGREQLDQDNLSRGLNFLLQARSKARKLTTNARYLAISNTFLCDAYMRKGDYEKAFQHLDEAKRTNHELSINDPVWQSMADSLAKHYKTLEIGSFDADIRKKLVEAGVTKIAVQKEPEKAIISIDLNEKYQAPMESEDVTFIGFGKHMSFELFSQAPGNYQIAKIQGLQARTKSMWVNLLETVLFIGGDGPPIAQVTAGKMGRTKTVKVTLPEAIVARSRELLDSFKKMINVSATATDSSEIREVEKPPVEAKNTDSIFALERNGDLTSKSPAQVDEPSGAGDETSPPPTRQQTDVLTDQLEHSGIVERTQSNPITEPNPDPSAEPSPEPAY